MEPQSPNQSGSDGANWQAPQSSTPPQPSQSPYGNWQKPVDPVLPPVGGVAPEHAIASNIPPSPAPSTVGVSRAARQLNLSKGEYIISDVRRHPIGVLQIYFVATFLLLVLLFGGGALVRYVSTTPQEGIVGGSAFPFPVELITGLAFGLGLLTVVIAAIAIHVYRGNRLFVTNESVIQHVQTSLFSTKQQTIGLGNIEDVSFEQSGIFPHMFHYGTIRLSTEGEETTYYFRFASHPKEQADKITDAQEAFNRLHPEHHY